MYLTQTNLIRGLSKREYLMFRMICFFSKNLYNVTLYNIRQYYFTEKKHLRYESNYHLTKENENEKLTVCRIEIILSKILGISFSVVSFSKNLLPPDDSVSS